MGIRTDLLVTEEIAESSDLRATPFEFERAKRVEAALSILEGKWKIVILNRLFARPIWRFSELERAVPGISQRMLSQQLRLLEKCELVKRTVHPQFPILRVPIYCPVTSTTRKRALPCIMRAYASAACSSGNVSIMGRIFSKTLKTSVSSLSIGVPVSVP